jgi:hypothetical protein
LHGYTTRKKFLIRYSPLAAQLQGPPEKAGLSCEGSPLKSRLEVRKPIDYLPSMSLAVEYPKGRRLESIFGRDPSWKKRFEAPATTGLKHRPEFPTTKIAMSRF